MLGDSDTVVDCYFPEIDSYFLTSDEDDKYNCIAHAAGIVIHPIWPDPQGILWLPGVKNLVPSIAAFMEMYEVWFNYQPFELKNMGDGYENIVIFALDDEVKHAARQLENKKWTSKLGPYKDIQHESPESVQGDAYGYPVQYMRRKLSSDDCTVKYIEHVEKNKDNFKL